MRMTAEMASQLNPRVVVYPHHGLAVSTMLQAIELVRRSVSRKFTK